MAFEKAIGRHRVRVSRDGAANHDYGHGAEIEFRDGWNGECDLRRLTMSVDELRDLHYTIGRALEAAGVRL